MADIVGSKLITEEDLDTITLRAAMEDILGDENSTKWKTISNFNSHILPPLIISVCSK